MFMRKPTVTFLSLLGMLALAGPAAADTGTLTGGATRQGNEVTLVSNVGDASTTNDTSAETHSVPTGATFEDLKSLGAEYNPTDDGCVTGSPAFQLTVDGKLLSVNFAAAGCTLNAFTATGELVGSTGAIWDLTAFGGSSTSTHAQALALLTGKPLTGIALVVGAGGDVSFADKEQTVIARQVRHVVTGDGEGEGAGQAKPNPSRQCQTLRASMTPAAFNAMWQGVNASGRNAFGKCVSTMAQAEDNGNGLALQRAINADVRTCKAERRSNPAAFQARFGTKGAGLGKCVLAHAKTDLARLSGVKVKRRP
jgi:hypothetical protein